VLIVDIATHGCAGGFSGLTYYTETTELFDKFHDDIWEVVEVYADNYGVSPIEFIASCKASDGICDTETFKNFLVWLAVESIASDLRVRKRSFF